MILPLHFAFYMAELFEQTACRKGAAACRKYGLLLRFLCKYYNMRLAASEVDSAAGVTAADVLRRTSSQVASATVSGTHSTMPKLPDSP